MLNKPDERKRRLTGKQAAFVREYLVDLNATQAAIRAGYKANTAGEIAYENLKKPQIAEAVQAGMDIRAKKTGITAERVLKEIARLAFFDIRKLYDENGKPLPLTELDDDTAAAVVGIELVTVGNAEMGVGEVLKLKLADKAKALDQAGRHLKLFTDKVEVEIVDALADRLKAARERSKQVRR